MKPAIGLVELNSIAVGFLVTDTMVKKAQVKILESTPICPGKFMVLVSGDEASVEESMNSGVTAGFDSVVDKLYLPNVHEQVIPAISGTTEIKIVKSVGIIETLSVASTIISADASAKAADVSLIEIRLAKGLGGKSYFIFTGELDEVQASMEAGVDIIKDEGWLIRRVIIPSPHIDMIEKLL